jgi:Bacterial Ig domain
MAQARNFAAAVLAVALSSNVARATLQDHGPLDPTITFPTWYRDPTGVALQMCRSTTQSPNAAAGLGAFCFPTPADPTGFPGNIGGEIFYADASATLAGPAFSMKYVAALEAAYLSPLGNPVRGQEVVFGRIRIVMNTSVAGTYKVTHPYGVELFPDMPAGKRALAFTEDVTPIPGNFDAPLAARVGPFLQWDQLMPGETLTVTNAAGQTEQFVGDPNYDHSFTGSPFDTNYIRVDGPPGSNLDGVGNDYVVATLAAILGQAYTAPIPQPLVVKRASYGRDPSANVASIDVFAAAPASAKLVLSGTDLPSVVMKGDGRGHFVSHVELPLAAPMPNFVRVTNVNDPLSTSQTATLHDSVEITRARYDTLTQRLDVRAQSSDQLAPPLLAVEGADGGPMTNGEWQGPCSAGIPPESVSVVSSAAGRQIAEVIVVPGLPDNAAAAPVALADALRVDVNASATVSVTANDAVAAGVGAVLVVSAPASGAVSVSAAGDVTYTPSANYMGPDSFEYVVQDAAGVLSNAALVTVDVVFTARPPVANGDNASLAQNGSRTLAVLANDVAAAGTALDPASVAVATAPLHGTARVNADGTITYTPVQGWFGNDAFTYTVRNQFGQASNAAAVTLLVTASNEFISFTKADFVRSKSQYTLVGTTTAFGAGVTPSMTCWVGNTAGAGAFIATVPVDATGKFQVQAVAPAPDATGMATCRSSNGGSASARLTLK